jgi:hypothetical protein
LKPFLSSHHLTRISVCLCALLTFLSCRNFLITPAGTHTPICLMKKESSLLLPLSPCTVVKLKWFLLLIFTNDASLRLDAPIYTALLTEIIN